MDKTGEHKVGSPCTYCSNPATTTLGDKPVCSACGSNMNGLLTKYSSDSMGNAPIKAQADRLSKRFRL